MLFIYFDKRFSIEGGKHVNIQIFSGDILAAEWTDVKLHVSDETHFYETYTVILSYFSLKNL